MGVVTGRKRKAARRPTGRKGWWGEGPPPSGRWPGVTIEIPARYVSARSRWETPDGRYYFDHQAADDAESFFPFLTHHIGEFAGQPFRLLDYQRLLLTRPIFGWKRANDGLRRFRKLFFFAPKASGKSPWGSATGLYLTLFDREPGAECYAVAAEKNQARIVHTNAKIMVEESSHLRELAEVWKDAIYCPATRSTYQVLSADAATKHGFRPHGVIFDEFHAQRNRDLYEALKKSMVKRRQPLMVLISHAGDDDESICYEEYEYAKGVLSGTIPDDTCLPVIFEASAEDEWTSPEVWKRVNPGYGVTAKADALAAECQEARSEPRKLNDFLRFHLNRWVNQATAWIPIDWWDACQGASSDRDFAEQRCAAGLDLAQKWDLACFAVVFRELLDDASETVDIAVEDEPGQTIGRPITLNYRVTVVPFFWIPENTMREHERRDGVPYSLWREQGLVTATEGDVIDYTHIYRDITEKIVPRFPNLKEATIGYDPAFATDLATKLRDYAGLQMVEVRQNYTDLSEPCQIFEALVKGGRVRHDGHRLLRWNVENVAVKRDDAGRIRPVKPKKVSKRIDGVVATIMALKMLSLIESDYDVEISRDFATRGLW